MLVPLAFLDIEMGDTMKGIVVGGLIAAMTTVITQLFVWWIQKREFAHQERMNRDTLSIQAKQERDRLVIERMWDRRADAYALVIAAFSEIQMHFDRIEGIGTGRLSALKVGEAMENEKQQAQVQFDTARDLALYLNDRSLKAIEDYVTQSRESVAKAAKDHPDNERQRDIAWAQEGQRLANHAKSTIRTEALEHLGDKEKSLANKAEDANKLAQGR
jgi:hypothetical protein